MRGLTSTVGGIGSARYGATAGVVDAIRRKTLRPTATRVDEDAGATAAAPPHPRAGGPAYRSLPRAASISSRLRGQSLFKSRESERSASSTPPVWQRAQ